MTLGTPSDDQLPRPGRAVHRIGRYRVLSEIGRGGMAAVYLASLKGPTGVNKLVVLKALLPELASEPESLRMFLEEARLAAQLNHANVVQTYEVGTEDDQHVIVMEYLEGQSLANVARRGSSNGEAPALALLLRVILETLEGLHYAHEMTGYDGQPLHIVHRDVSPQNVFVTYDGQVKVLDFGIAKVASSSIHTATGVIKGKVAYMPPEQMAGDPIDRRADVYAVGCMLWAVAAGEKLWKDLPDVQIMKRVLNGEIPSPRDKNPDCDEELERIVMKALANEREGRYASALDMHHDLESYVEARGLQMKPKQVGAYVSTLFAETRAELRALVERQLAAISNEQTLSTDNAVAIARLHHIQNEISSRTDAASAARSGANTHATGSATGRHLAWFLSGALVAAVALGVVLWQAGGAAETRGAEPSRAAPVEPAAPPPPEPAPSSATVRIEVEPHSAQLTLDGRTLSTNPTSERLPLDGQTHTLRAEAPQHTSWQTEFVLTADKVIRHSLSPIAPVASAGPAEPPRRAQRRRPAASSPEPAPSARPAAPKCQIPYFVDADGIRRLRPECL